MASMGKQQQRPPPEVGAQPEAKRARQSGPLVSREPGGRRRVELNPADCDLDFDVEGNGLQGHALYEQGFAYCWSGARATVGITGGKYCFGCKIISDQKVDMEDTPPDQQHVCRVGISRGDGPVGNLGESEHSFGFGGTGKFSNAGKFVEYGAKFGVGDTIVCCVNLENIPLASIGFSKNGKWLGSARQFDAGPRGLGVVNSALHKLPWESALFPHVLLKNVVVQMQFSIEDELVPEEGYRPWNCALEDGNAITGPSFSSPKECEVRMLVGLPASGKSTWAEKWVKEHPEKRYVLLGTNLALDQMKVPGLLRKQNYGERFERLMDRATGIFNTLLARAAKTPRNYILDQTNVYKNARKRKLKAFTNYRKIAVVIFPTPNELKFRADKRFKEMGKEVPAEAVNEMLANYVLPVSKDMSGADEFFDEVIFPELSRGETQRYLDEMKHALGSTSNMSGKSDFSPYSRESSIQSRTTPSVTNKVVSDSGRGWETSHSPSPLTSHDYRNPLQVSSAYSRSGSYGIPEFSSAGYQSRSRDPSLPVPTGSPYESHSNYGRTSLRRNELDPYGSCGMSDPFDGRSIPFGVSDPYCRPVENDAYSRPNLEMPNFVKRLDYGDPRTPLSYTSPGAHLGNPTMPRVDHQAVREPAFQRHSPFPGAPLTHSSLGANPGDPRVYQAAREPSFDRHSPFPTTYGLPYEAPPPNPSFGATPSKSYVNLPPTERRYSEGCPPSGTWYR